ncbi:MAG TPA: hypothetical protein VFQ45_10655 [Longimicrobium sp.]|nr:hypothetical protein [Longimicrobium sp.]
MDRRHPARLSAALLLALMAAACGRAPARPVASLAAGKPAPAEWTPVEWRRPVPVYVVWLVRTADCLSCQFADYEFRRVAARFGPEVPLLTVHVGRPAAATVPQGFLRSRRLQSRVQTISPAEFARRHGDATLPAILLVRDGVIAWTSSARPPKGTPPVRLDTLVAMHRQLSAARARAPATDDAAGRT